MSAIVPGKVIDLAARGQVSITSEKVIRQAGVNIDKGHIPQAPGDHIITVVSLTSGEVWHIPADDRLLAALHSRLTDLLFGDNPASNLIGGTTRVH